MYIYIYMYIHLCLYIYIPVSHHKSAPYALKRAIYKRHSLERDAGVEVV